MIQIYTFIAGIEVTFSASLPFVTDTDYDMKRKNECR
jgi:hypothetical protein